MEILNFNFSKQIVIRNFTVVQTNLETDTKTHLDTERLGDNLLNSHRGATSIQESKQSPLQRTTQNDFYKQTLRNIVTSKADLDFESDLSGEGHKEHYPD